jgi:hypothetical protein
MDHKQSILIGCFAVLFTLRASSQSIALPPGLDSYDFNSVKIEYLSESYKRVEMNTFYIYENAIRMHSVSRCYDPKNNRDTVITLNSSQIMALNSFERKLRAGLLTQPGLIIAGTRATYTLRINEKEEVFTNKINYSLLDALIQAFKQDSGN